MKYASPTPDKRQFAIEIQTPKCNTYLRHELFNTSQEVLGTPFGVGKQTPIETHALRVAVILFWFKTNTKHEAAEKWTGAIVTLERLEERSKWNSKMRNS